jgi:hypothetical protein
MSADAPLISKAALAAARRLIADPALFERAVHDVDQRFDYDGWEVDDSTVLPALRAASAGARHARDVEIMAADARLGSEFLCRISASGMSDYYEGDDPDPGLFELGPAALEGTDLSDALRQACDLAEQYGWVAAR